MSSNDKKLPETTANKVSGKVLNGLGKGAKNVGSYLIHSPKLLLLTALIGAGYLGLKTCKSTEPTVKKTITTLGELSVMNDRSGDMPIGDKDFHIQKEIIIDQNRKFGIGDFSIGFGKLDDESRTISIQATSEFGFKFDVIKNKSISTLDSIDNNKAISHRTISLSNIDQIDTLKVILTNKTSTEETEKWYQGLSILEDKEKTKNIIDSTIENSKSDIYQQFLNDLQRNPTEYINLSMKSFWKWLVESRRLTDSQIPKKVTLQITFTIGDKVYTAQTENGNDINITSIQQVIRDKKN